MHKNLDKNLQRPAGKMATFEAWKERSERALEACRRLGGKADPLRIKPPAALAEVRQVEKNLGIRLPQSFRRVLTNFASAFAVRWFLPDGLEPPEPVSDIFSGGLSWDLAKLGELEEGRRSWVKECFPNPDDDYDRVWHGKLAIHEVGDGDLVALDIAGEGEPALVYLSHADGEGHGYAIGPSFEEAIARWIQVGCVGTDDSQWLPFVSSPISGIEPDCDNAKVWRRWFGLEA